MANTGRFCAMANTDNCPRMQDMPVKTGRALLLALAPAQGCCVAPSPSNRGATDDAYATARINPSDCLMTCSAAVARGTAVGVG